MQLLKLNHSDTDSLVPHSTQTAADEMDTDKVVNASKDEASPNAHQ